MTRNKAIAAAALFVGMLLVVFVVVSDYPAGDGSISGTMADPDKKVAGVEKADRSRTPQISDADVELDDASFQQLMQDDDFVAIVTSGELAASFLDRTSNALGEKTFTNAVERGDFLEASYTLTRRDYLAKEFAKEFGKANFDMSATAYNDLNAKLAKKMLEARESDLDRQTFAEAYAQMQKSTVKFDRMEREKLAKMFQAQEFGRDLSDMKAANMLEKIQAFYRNEASRSLFAGATYQANSLNWERATEQAKVYQQRESLDHANQ
jgi:hypothetical protein